LSPALRTQLARWTSVAAALIYAVTLVEGAPGAARVAALVLATFATIGIVEGADAPRPAAMVSIAAIMLLLEGAATTITQELDKAAFIEIGLGIYLMATLHEMVRGTRGIAGNAQRERGPE
jgi:hypothetical protein